ncbi:hypothetical protein GmHk_05G012764 [Glycine max]|nr:hypothetical protein GmHk_05G012764 [Glycine max]
MECCHEEELRKLKADHNELEARVRLPKGDRHSTHTINEHTQGESHPRQTNNTLNDNNISHAHHHEGQTTQQKWERGESSARTYSHKSEKRNKPDKRKPLSRGPRYERYTPLITNRATILKEAFNAEIPIQLPPITLPRPRLDRTKHYRYYHNHDHNIEDCWALRDKIKELIQAKYLAQFVKKLDEN